MSSALTEADTSIDADAFAAASGRAARERLVVIGNGPVGWKLCDLLSRQARKRQPVITIFGEEPEPAYDRVHLTTYFQHRDASKLELASSQWYEERQIDLRTNDPVVELDTRIKRVRTRSGQIAFYDKLVFATGSRPFVPPIPGVESEHVHLYRTIRDLEAIAADIDRLKNQDGARAAVLGGGLLGLEAAQAFSDAGIETHVFEMASVLMPKQLDTPAAELLQREVETLGVKVHTLARTQAIRNTKAGRLRLVLDGDDDRLEFDTVIVSAGIRPRDELAVSGGIKVDDRGGILVSDKLETSAPDVYAVGECAVHNDTIYGLIAPGYHMAGVVAERLTSRSPLKPTFKGHDNATRLKLLGVDVVTLGDFLQEDSDTRVLTFSEEHSYRKLILKGNRLVGATLVGKCEELPRLSEAVDSKRRLSQRSLRRFVDEGRLWVPSDAQHVSEWPANATVCSCLQISRGTLTKACEGGCSTVDQLICQTQASTICGSCRPLLAELIGQPETAGGVAGWKALGWLSGLSGAGVIAAASVGPWRFADSFQSPRFQWDLLLLDNMYKQVTGFTLVALTVIAASLSLRKRIPKVNFGTYGLWRVFHSAIGLLCLVGLIAHTGFRTGNNLNFVLMLSFVGTIAVGAITGVITSYESKAGTPPSPWVKTWRPYMTWAHILLTWPLPVLIVFHALAFYMNAE